KTYSLKGSERECCFVGGTRAEPIELLFASRPGALAALDARYSRARDTIATQTGSNRRARPGTRRRCCRYHRRQAPCTALPVLAVRSSERLRPTAAVPACPTSTRSILGTSLHSSRLRCW